MEETDGRRWKSEAKNLRNGGKTEGHTKRKVMQRKRAFTIVELVVVMAVLAVLSAILVPTLTGIMSSAELQNGKRLIRNLNTILVSETNGENKDTSIEEAVAYVEDNGISAENLVEDSKNIEILYDAENGQFVLLNLKSGADVYFTGTAKEDYENLDINFWKFYDKSTLTSNEEYSIYIVGNEEIGEVEVNGVDFNAGKNENISSVKFIGSESRTAGEIEVSLTTNGGNLQVQSNNEKINHYGKADSVVIEEVSKNSYHENGEVFALEIAKGHLVLENTAKVENLELKSTEVEGKTSFEDIFITKKENASLPNIKFENIKIYENDAITIANFEIYNDKADSAKYKLKFSGNKQKVLEPEDEKDPEEFVEILDGIYEDVETIEIEVIKSADEYANYEKIEVNSVDDWTKIINQKQQSFSEVYISLKTDLDLLETKIKGKGNSYTNLVIEGNGNKIAGLNCGLLGKDASIFGNLTIKNLVIENVNLNRQALIVNNITGGETVELTLENVKINNCNFQETSALVGGCRGTGKKIFNIVNCEISNTLYESKDDNIGGLFGEIGNSNVIVNGLKIKNTKMVSSENANIYGIVASVENAKNLKVSNLEIDKDCVFRVEKIGKIGVISNDETEDYSKEELNNKMSGVIEISGDNKIVNNGFENLEIKDLQD